ncbi:hypothetical protein N9924_01310 [bacterium]|nr:hypothetical protein [bacterium]
MGLNKERLKHGEECCKLANERFGLMMGMRELLKWFNLNDNAVDYVIDLAQKRDLEVLSNVVDMIGTMEVIKPRFVRIEPPAKLWNPSEDPDNDEHALNRFK